ncbi:MAG: DUF222 domain-containing protein [Ilumatobacteraceae bacterium]
MELDSIYSDVAGVCGHVNAQQARLVRLTERVVSEHVWEESGCRTAAHWLAWQTGTASSTARKILAVAERAASRPVLMAAFDAGELSLDQMALAVKAPAYTDAEMCGFARNATVTQLSTVVRRYGFEPDPGDPPADAAAAPDRRRRRRCRCGSTMPAPVMSRQPWNRTGSGCSKPRCAKPATPCSTQVTRTSPGPTHWSRSSNRSLDTVTERSRRDRFRVNMYIHATTDRSTTFADNWRVPDALRDLYLCDGSVTPIYVIDGIPVNVGRAQPIVPDRTRRLVEHRDLGCRVPGCTQTRWVQVHHVVHRSEHGDTDTWNLICLCPTHHRMHHRNQLGITGNADLPPGTPGAVVFTDARGRCIEPGATPVAPGGPPPAPTGTMRNTHWVNASTTGPSTSTHPVRTHADTN